LEKAEGKKMKAGIYGKQSFSSASDKVIGELGGGVTGEGPEK